MTSGSHMEGPRGKGMRSFLQGKDLYRTGQAADRSEDPRKIFSILSLRYLKLEAFFLFFREGAEEPRLPCGQTEF
jgi:hypothetical protein